MSERKLQRSWGYRYDLRLLKGRGRGCARRRDLGHLHLLAGAFRQGERGFVVKKKLDGTEVEVLDFSWTGHANQYLAPLKRSISAVCRRDRGVSDFYIGIASGPDFFYALDRRIDGRKLKWGCAAIWNMYTSRSLRSVAWLETELIDHYRARGDLRLRNAVRGGGGRMNSQPYNFLYLAFNKDGSLIDPDAFV